MADAADAAAEAAESLAVLLPGEQPTPAAATNTPIDTKRKVPSLNMVMPEPV